MDDYQPMRNAQFLKTASENIYSPHIVLRSAMEASGMQSKELAKLTGYVETTIYNWRKGSHEIGFSKMNDCLNAMGFQIRFEEIK